jgi:acetyltransferase
MNDLKALFTPKSIAVVGASKDPNKLGYVLLKNVMDYGFKGNIYPVNPKADVILERKAYPDVSSIPGSVDLALLSIPGQFVLPVVEDCAKAGVKSLVILSSGFREAGADGVEVQNRIKDVCRSSGIRALGPNCMGIYNISGNLNGTYFWELPRVQGNISFVSQSGAYGGILFNEIRQRKVGISKFASIGNMVDINHADVLRYLSTDKDTEVIAVFIEGLQDGREFMEVASEVSRVKPIVAFKVGRTVAGTRAARSHTGAMAGSFEAYEAAFKQSGVILARNSEEFFDVTMALSSWNRSIPKNENVAILTISGGPCVAAGDTCEEIGLKVPEFSQKTQQQIKEHTPFFGASSNPVDMTPQMSPDNYEPCVDTVFSQDEIGGVIAINVGLDRPEFAKAFVKASKKYSKPVVSFTIDTPELSQIFRDSGIPIYPTPERSVYAYNGLVRYRRNLRRDERREAKDERVGDKAESRKRDTDVGAIPRLGRPSPLAEVPKEAGDFQRESPLLKRFVDQGKKALGEYDAGQVLQEYGIPICRGQVAKSIKEAVKYAEETGYPVVAKIHSVGGDDKSPLLHKSDAGGVFVSLRNERELSDACQKLLEKFGSASQFLIQESVPSGVEVMIGGKRDETFGPTIMFGLGGVFTEIMKDVSLRICPIDETEATEMIQELKGYPLLTGYRGKEKCDVKGIAETLVKVSHLLLSNPEIKELDINPLIAHELSLTAVDALMIL